MDSKEKGTEKGRETMKHFTMTVTVKTVKKYELKACPFCGGEPEKVDKHDAIVDIRCRECKSSVGESYIDNFDDAVDRWNRRP